MVGSVCFFSSFLPSFFSTLNISLFSLLDFKTCAEKSANNLMVAHSNGCHARDASFRVGTAVAWASARLSSTTCRQLCLPVSMSSKTVGVLGGKSCGDPLALLPHGGKPWPRGSILVPTCVRLGDEVTQVKCFINFSMQQSSCFLFSTRLRKLLSCTRGLSKNYIHSSSF